jgi:uncharacterized protein
MFPGWKKVRMDNRPENPAPETRRKDEQQPARPVNLAPAPEFLQPSAHPVHSVFVGPSGLRSGWRITLFILFAALFAFTLMGFLSHWHPHGAGLLWQNWIVEAALFLSVTAASLLMSKIESRPWGDYGLPLRAAFGKNFWVGALWGFFWITALMLIMRAIGVFDFGGIAVHGARMARFAAFYALLFLTVSFFEESLFRGYAQFTLTQGIGFWPAAFLLTACFGAVHLGNQGEAWIGILGAAFIGLFLCLTLRRTNSLWFAVGFHASWDWCESFLYSVPDSGQIAPGHLLSSSFHGSRWLTGGSVGPEGSLLALIIVALATISFSLVYRPQPARQSPTIQS